MSAIRVVISGAVGRMGQSVVRAVSSAGDMELVGAYDRSSDFASTGALLGAGVTDVPITNKLGALLDEVEADVLVDFTHLSGAADHALSAMKRKVAPIIGTSGLGREDVRAIQMGTEDFHTPALIAPNFAIGAVLLTRFAEMSAKYFPAAEVIELHHAGKLDAPSGTASHTAELIAAARTSEPELPRQAVEKVAGARGGKVKNVPVHSVRLPGFVASQEVIFGGAGERLTLRHDSLDRESFMPGVLLAIREVRGLTGLTVGLEHLLLS